MGHRRANFFLLAAVVMILASPDLALPYVGPEDVLILVNQNSPTSLYTADLYREYYPSIASSQVFAISGLTDCSGPSSTAADEIITRSQYETSIAEPLRAYLIANDMVDSVKVIITTAGLPYRIEDTFYNGINHSCDVITPAGGNCWPITLGSSFVRDIDAASVESELTLLFHTDPNSTVCALYSDRIANVYQGFRSGFDLFARDILARRSLMKWVTPRSMLGTLFAPRMEGRRSSYGVRSRTFCPGDMYLTCRLDGPKDQGQTAVFAIHAMLESARRASSSQYGINPVFTTMILDEAPNAYDHNKNYIYNLQNDVEYLIWDPCNPQMPSMYIPELRDDFESCFWQATGRDLVNGYKNTGLMSLAHNSLMICDTRNNHRSNQTDLYPWQVVSGLTNYGVNGDEGHYGDYLLTGGPGGGPLFNLAYGSVFNSIESYNAATLFSDVAVSYNQGKIINFLQIGGTGTMGHSFEPRADAIIDNEFFLYNLFTDSDGDNFADMTFIEAAFTGLPFLSWTEIVIGDPLMRIAYGPGGQAKPLIAGDLNHDGIVNQIDTLVWTQTFLCQLHCSDPNYNDIADIDFDGIINFEDFALIQQ